MGQPTGLSRSTAPQTPSKLRPLRASGLLAQFGSSRSHSSVSQARKLSQATAEAEAVHSPNVVPLSPAPLPKPSPERLQLLKKGTILSESDSEDELQRLNRSDTAKNAAAHRSARFPRSIKSREDLKTIIDLEPYKRGSRKRKTFDKSTESILVSDMAKTPERMRPKRRPPPPKLDTVRSRIRSEMQSVARTKRDRFLLEYNEYFLPLLPQNNYIKRLADGKLGNLPERAVDYEDLKDQPFGVTATLKPYQLSGLAFLMHLHRNGMPGLLGDEMGLGKTLQTLSLFQYLEEANIMKATKPEAIRPYLVVCPLSVLSSWINEARKWTPALRVLQLHGAAKERDRLKRVALGLEDFYGHELAKTRKAHLKAASQDNGGAHNKDYNLIVTTYECFVLEAAWFKTSFAWRYVVLDEGHRIKNEKSNVSQALQSLQAEYRLILTGTPLQNNLAEMWALLHWLLPDVFTEQTAAPFRESFDLGKGHVNTKFLDSARRLLELLMLRRTKSSPEVNLGLPPKEEVLLYVPIAPMQKYWYTRLLTGVGDGLLNEVFGDIRRLEEAALNLELAEKQQAGRIEALQEGLQQSDDDAWAESRAIMQAAALQETESSKSATKSAWRRLMNLLMQLRKCCNHPYLIPDAVPEKYIVGPHVIQASGKFIVLDKILQHLVIKQQRKVLIFSGFTGVLDCVEDLLTHIGGNDGAFTFVRLDGSTARARRNLNIRMFNDTASTHKVMLISTRAGGLGINLTSAADVIFMDEDWNPQITLQAEARAHRIGQTKPVTIYKLCTQGTVEEQMLGRIRKKLYLSAKITESMQTVHGTNRVARGGRQTTDEEMPQMSATELKTLIRRGAQTLTHPQVDVNKMLLWDYEQVMANCRDKASETSSEEGSTGAVKDEKAWLSTMERVQSAVFEGKRYQRARKEAESTVLPDEITRADRRRGKNTTVLVDGYRISKESMRCADWEAVPTFVGKDPRLAEPKRTKRRETVNQEYCHVCFDGGKLILCNTCPRSFHRDCMAPDALQQLLGFNGACPQHECVQCEKNATEAGGLIYRCRWCEHGYCEDCLEWEKTTLIGDNLLEYEILGFPRVNQAFYIVCPQCNDRAGSDGEFKTWMDEQAADIQTEHKDWLATLEPAVDPSISAPPSLISSEVATASDRTLATTPLTIPQTDLTHSKPLDPKELDEALLSPKKRAHTRTPREISPAKCKNKSCNNADSPSPSKRSRTS